MADEVSLSGVALPGDPVAALEAVPMQYVDLRTASSLSDIAHYGDYWSTFPRMMSTSAKAMTLGVSYFSSSIASDTFTAARLRVYCTTASAGTGAVRFGVYTGPSLASLTPRAAIANLTSAVAGLYDQPLTQTVAITPGLYVCIGILVTGFTTIPTWQSLGGGGGPTGLISPAASMRYAAQSAGSQTALPNAAISMASYTGAGNPHWFALTP